MSLEVGSERASKLLIWIVLGCGLAWLVACGGEETPPPEPAPAPAPSERQPEVIPPAPSMPGATAPEAGAPAAAGTEMSAEEEDPYFDEESFAEALEGLRSDDPDDRADAVLDLEPEGRGLPYLLEVVGDDPDPEVRIAAIGQLEDGESPEAVAGLVRALDDADSEVVLEAIDALEFAADYTVVGSRQKLSQHPDPEVREAAADAIEYLEE